MHFWISSFVLERNVLTLLFGDSPFDHLPKHDSIKTTDPSGSVKSPISQAKSLLWLNNEERHKNRQH